MPNILNLFFDTFLMSQAGKFAGHSGEGFHFRKAALLSRNP
jgi:hypothetical protein